MMSRILGVVLLVTGILLIIWGFDARNSLASDVSNLFTGTPTDKTLWLFGLGIVSSIVGLVLSVRPGKRDIRS